ncbi:uncharacterized protein yc1106_09372 [Curvularia clavata]|uniref:DUF7730 domain-containing protein n=1 Tax=Curvularia clavata TaxID=95742 RepID=A0A9Q8ZL87_CURCL|nr:uncharacterized protein yc1106_09372 [Curvularia clavata]
MSDAAASTQTFASGRYSKRKRTQVTYHLDDLDYSDTESDFEIPQAKKPKAKTTSKPLPQRKIFRFLDLPAELRNTIYSYTLSDPAGINIVGAFRHRRRTVMRMPAEFVNTPDGPRRRIQRYMNERNADHRKALPPIVPSLLAVNKQIYAEAVNILYDNEFVFIDSSSLYAFLINLGPSGARRLKSIRIMGWLHSRGKITYNHACFALLAWATNLTSLHIESPIGYWRSTNLGVDQFYRDAFPWIEAFGTAKGKRDAAIDILQLEETCFPNWRDSSGGSSHAEKVKKFKDMLVDYLNKRHNLIMAGPSKSAKKAKKKAASDEE